MFRCWIFFVRIEVSLRIFPATLSLELYKSSWISKYPFLWFRILSRFSDYLDTLPDNLLPEEIGLVEEDDEWFESEELVVGHSRKQLQTVRHPVDLRVLGQNLIINWEINQIIQIKILKFRSKKNVFVRLSWPKSTAIKCL